MLRLVTSLVGFLRFTLRLPDTRERLPDTRESTDAHDRAVRAVIQRHYLDGMDDGIVLVLFLEEWLGHRLFEPQP